MKKKMDFVTKLKLMLFAEYLIFAAVFAVLGILFLVDVIKVAEWKRYVFTYVTLAGGVWLIVDFFWTMFSPKRRKKHAMIDKWFVFPVGIALLVFDIYAITQGCAETLPYRYVIGADLCYLGSVYVFYAIYHWYFPIPGILDEAIAAMEEEEREKAELDLKPEPLEKKDDPEQEN